MASSRRTGTNESVATYGTGKTYTALATWEADTDVDLVTATTSYVLEVYGNSYSNVITLAGATTNASYFRIIRPATGNFLTSGAITTKHFISTGNADVFAITENYSQVQDMVATISINNAANRNVFTAYGNFTGGTFVGCVAMDGANTGTGVVNGFNLAPNTTSGNKIFAINCLAHSNDGDGFVFAPANSGYGIAYNCTSTDNGGIGFNGNSSIYCVIKNCGATGNGTSDIEAGTFHTHSCSSSAPTFVDSANDDFHLAAGDTTWKDAGEDLSTDSDGYYSFDDDIDKATRSGTWDIGWDEYVSAGGGDLSINVSDCVAPITLLGG